MNSSFPSYSKEHARLAATTERLGADRPVQRLHAETSWRELIEPISKLKVLLDRVLNSNAWRAGEVTEADKSSARAYGFTCDEAPSGTGVDPDKFAEWIVGTFQQSGTKTMSRGIARVPSWSVIGWKRRRHQASDFADAQRRRAGLDEDTVAGHDGVGRWISPLPLVICVEGKHRAEMHSEYFDDMLVNLDVSELPPASALRLKHVFGAPNVLALQCRIDGSWRTKLLPFADLSLPLLLAMGVAPPKGWWVALPWSTPISDAIRTRTKACPKNMAVKVALRPRLLQSLIVDAGYV